MKHKIIAIALMLLSVMIGGISAQAQNVGEWRMYSLFSGGITSLVDAKNKVYYVSASRLYSYDKRTNETYSYSSDNVLNDTNVTGIYYNADKGFLLVTYDTANIDVILDKDDSVINMSDIADANLTYTKTINEVVFKDDRIFVGTTFGLVVYDSNKFTVTESGIYGISLEHMCVSGNTLLIYSSYSYYYASLDSRLNTFDKFTLLRSGNSGGIYGTDNGFYEYDAGAKLLRLRVINWSTGKTTETIDTDITTVPTYNKNNNGNYYFVTGNAILFIDEKDGSITSRTTLPEDIASHAISFSKDLSSVWAGDANGVGNYNIADGTLTVLADKSKPTAVTCDQVAYIRPAHDGSRVYISNIGDTNFKSIGAQSGNGENFVQRTDVIIEGEPYNAALYVASANKSTVKNQQKANNSTAMYGGCERFCVDKDDPEKYYIANWFEGVYVCKNNVEVGRFDSSNMLTDNWWTSSETGATCSNCEIDPQGNLWVGTWAYKNYKKYSPYAMLPKKYLDGDLSAVTKDNWQMSKHLGVDCGNHDMGSLFCKKSTLWFTWHSSYGNPLGVYETKGTYDDTSDDTYFELENLKDTDGGSYVPSRWICAVEDQKGTVWFGTTLGVVTIPDPTKVVDVSYQITRPKVPRNDGTNYADYLLDSEQVNDISVDAANRKWIATENSGLYCVSEDGDEIIENFTTDNSPLPSNAIYSVYCDPNSNLVYVGLASGLMTYRTTTTPAQSDYSNVLAFPNPVRPEYTGWITVSGLMENSLVKIADSAGNVVYQARSTGGSVVWDGCNADGSRVNTGVYLVLASNSDNDSATSVVTKILVVK